MTDQLFTDYLHELHQLPAGWAWYWAASGPPEAPEGFIKIKGAVAPTCPKTGRPNWQKKDWATERVFFIAKDAWQAWREERARKLDQCLECEGSGQTVAKIEIRDNQPHRTYRTCRLCQGSGKYQEKAAP